MWRYTWVTQLLSACTVLKYLCKLAILLSYPREIFLDRTFLSHVLLAVGFPNFLFSAFYDWTVVLQMSHSGITRYSLSLVVSIECRTTRMTKEVWHMSKLCLPNTRAPSGGRYCREMKQMWERQEEEMERAAEGQNKGWLRSFGGWEGGTRRHWRLRRSL